MVKIALDAMGGDNAPAAVVQGALSVAAEDMRIVLVGDETALKQELSAHNPSPYVDIVHAPDIVGMDEEPARAVRVKKESSIVVAAKLVGTGQADALVSAGSTGAQLAASIFHIGRIRGIRRPAICTVYPTPKGYKLLTDAGANPEVKPEDLYQFALMGSIYAQRFLGIEHPRVGLINNGSEAKKGTEVVRQAYQLLSDEQRVDFVGNIEGRDVPAGNTDVMVCDGFVGNILLKLTEGLATTLLGMIREKLTANWVRKLGALMNRQAFRELKKQMDYSEVGGAPLLGVRGVSMICHGSSNEVAIASALKAAARAAASGYVTEIEAQLGTRTDEKNG